VVEGFPFFFGFFFWYQNASKDNNLDEKNQSPVVAGAVLPTDAEALQIRQAHLPVLQRQPHCSCCFVMYFFYFFIHF
jgi:hypothetical protein